MALDTCPDCNNSISTQAKSCPKCGRVLKSNKFGLGAIFYLALIVIGFVMYLGGTGIIPFAGSTVILVSAIGLIFLFLRAVVAK